MHRSASHLLHDLVAAARQQHGLVSREQTRALGVSAKVLNRLLLQGYVSRMLPDVFVVGGPPSTWQQKLVAGTLQLGPSAVVSGRAAAALLGFDTFRPGSLEFTVRQDVRARLAFGTVHRSAVLEDTRDRQLHVGIPCTTPIRTVFDLAAVLGRRRLEHVIDGGLRDGRFTDTELADVLARLRRSGRAGVRIFEEAIAAVDGPTVTSVLERRFLRLLAEGGVPLPDGQVVVEDRTGRFIGRVDFRYTGTPVIVEVEGHRYHSTRGQRQRDAERRNDLESEGNHVLVFTYEDVRERPAYVRAAVRRALAPYRHLLDASARVWRAS